MAEVMRPYHDGEREVQRRAGVGDLALKTAKVITPTIPLVARGFLAEQPMAVVASVGPEYGVWASLLAGEPGFMTAEDKRTVRVSAESAPGDPLRANLEAGDPEAPIGLLAIDLATRRRMKAKGKARLREGGREVGEEVGEEGRGFTLSTERVYALCPKYIQAREWEFGDASPTSGRDPEWRDILNAEQRRWISPADTFFIASHHPDTGADASHRGGPPGFVEVVDEGTLAWPDYPGNRIFNTLGNLETNPRAGLLFVDFEGGRTLQLVGEARVDWRADSAARYAGAERVVEFRVRRTLETPAATSLRWRLREYSPFNPR